jgi:hypothetical protein
MQKSEIGHMFSTAAFLLVVVLSGIRILLLVESSGNQTRVQIITTETLFYFYFFEAVQQI